MRELAVSVVLAIVGLLVFGMVGQGAPAATLASAQSAQAASAASNAAMLAALQAAQAQQAAQQAAQSAAASQASANQTLTILWVIIGLPVLALAGVGAFACLTTARRWMRRWARRMARDDAGEPLPPARVARRVAPPTHAIQVINPTPAPPPLVVNAPTAGWGWDADED
jgi:flagellar basal body-associated protein FliL